MKFIYTQSLTDLIVRSFLLQLFLLFNFAQTDLPVHCLKHDIQGNWKIMMTDLLPVSSGHEMKCGHNEPSTEETSYKAVSPYPFNQLFFLKLTKVNKAELVMNDRSIFGNWTMVYDEGFNINFDEMSMFAFSKYGPSSDDNSEKKNYNSLCFSTSVGWVRSKDGSKWGCYFGTKIGADPKKITYTDTKNTLNIIEPSPGEMKNSMDSLLSSMLNMHFKSIQTIITFDDDKLKKRSFLKSPASSFLAEKEFSMLKLDAKFSNHLLYISKLNSLQKSWKAGLYSDFSKKSIGELNKFAGRPRANIARDKSIYAKEVEDVSHLPVNFDWKDKVRPAGSQGNCGGCYAFSSLRMLEARLKIKYNHDVKLSVQHALDCSFYNQGCQGGYPFLIMKYSHDFDLIPEECKPYTEADGKCQENIQCDLNTLPYIYKAADYKYVGGSYGECSMKKMMEEVYKNGPIVVSFEPNYNFMLYKSGIFHSLNEESWMSKGLPKPEWEKVDHSVLLIGWGEDKNNEKFWIIQNTWGPYWGEEGFFRMKRGDDEFGIEGVCEAATPIIIDRKTGKEITELSSLSMNNFLIKKQNDHSNKMPSLFDIF